MNFGKVTKPARLGVLETGGWSVTTEGARQAFAAAKEKLAKAGVELKGRGDDPDIDTVEKTIADAQPLTLAINAWEGRWPLNTYADLDATKLSEGARNRLKIAEATTQAQYADLLTRRVAARAAYAKAASKYDAFVTLGACGAAPVGLGSTGNTAMNVAASLLGCPALTSLCCRTKACRSDCSFSARPTATRPCSTWRTGSRARRSAARTWWARRARACCVLSIGAPVSFVLGRGDQALRKYWVPASAGTTEHFRTNNAARNAYSASGVGFSGGGAIWNVLAVMQVIEKLPVVATSATRCSSPMVFSAAA